MHPFIDFLKQFPVKSFSRGSIVLHQGEVPRCAYVVKRGIIKSYNISDSGDEKPVAFKVRHEIMPTAWVFNKLSSALYFYEAVTDCELYCLPGDEIRSFIRNNHETQRLMLDKYVSAYIGQTLHINALEHSRANEKLLHTLYYLSVRFGRETAPAGTVKLDITLTQQELASLMGLTRETTGMELNKLKDLGVISFNRRHFLINTGELAKQMGEVAFEELHL